MYIKRFRIVPWLILIMVEIEGIFNYFVSHITCVTLHCCICFFTRVSVYVLHVSHITCFTLHCCICFFTRVSVYVLYVSHITCDALHWQLKKITIQFLCIRNALTLFIILRSRILFYFKVFFFLGYAKRMINLLEFEII